MELDPTNWTTIRNDQLSNENLSQRGHNLGIESLVFSNQGAATAASPKMVAATLQAIIGAVYQDGGDEAALRVVHNLAFTEHRLLVT